MLVLLQLLWASHGPIFTQYLIDNVSDENDPDEVKKIVEKENKKDGTLPPFIAYNIKAIKVPLMKDSIRISWSINPNYDDEFIVGRANEIIDTRERVLSSESVNVISSKSTNIHIDQGLKPGNYYYVIVAKDKIYGKDIELYRDINFTTIPVTIEAVETSNESVTNISAKQVSESRVAVTWAKIPKPGFTYLVYRAPMIINSSERIRKAVKAGTVIDMDEFIDNIPGGNDPFYYAVITRSSDGIEKFEPVKDQNFTSDGIKPVKKTPLTVTGILSGLINPGEIEVKWKHGGSVTDGEIGGFVIYRSKEMIDSINKLNSAVQVNSVPKNVFRIIDKAGPTGSYFYAVFAKTKDGVINLVFKKNENYSSTPVVITDKFEILSITGTPGKNSIEISWIFSGLPENSEYRLYRTRNYPGDPSKIREGDFIKTVNLKDRIFVDNKPQKGRFYYGLLPSLRDDEFKITKGVTVTRSPVSVGIPVKKREKTEKKEDPGDTIQSSTLDELINNTFFKGFYRETIKELKIVVNTADNEHDVAKAILFIGRSYIEMGEYSMALNYLIKKEVTKLYPNEARFWSEFAMIRVTK